MAKKKKDLGGKYAEGDAFIGEHTGSATLINVDGNWEHDFYDESTPAKKQAKTKNKS